MTKRQALEVFQDNNIRIVWDDATETWYFSVVDVCAALTGSIDPAAYWRKLKQRLKAEGNETVTNCHGLKLKAADGKFRMTDVADPEQLFRIIQSIPSPKAEPFKQWMAHVAAQRLDQMQNPELSIEQAVADYRRIGYSEEWIKARIHSIEVRKNLTDEWKRSGIEGNELYAALTNIITQGWSGLSVREYKDLKGLHRENLRDNMTPVELALNSLAEVSTTELSKKRNPSGFVESARTAQEGSDIAYNARLDHEARLGQTVISPSNAHDLYLAPTPEKPALPEE